MAIKIYNSKTNELLAELESFTLSESYSILGQFIVYAIWVNVPFSKPDDQKEPFRIYHKLDSGEETVYEEGWISDIMGAPPNIAVRITARKKGE